MASAPVPLLEPDRTSALVHAPASQVLTEESPHTLELTEPSTAPNNFQLTDQSKSLSTKRILVTYAAISLGLSATFLEQSIVGVAVPAIVADLGGANQQAWIASAYLLMSGAWQPPHRSDVFGRRQILLTVLTIFNLATIGCSLSQTMVQLIVFRAWQGVGGGSLLTLCLIVLGDVVPLRSRGLYQALIEINGACFNGIAPVLGGLFVEHTTWRWTFWVVLPLSFAACVSIFFFLENAVMAGSLRRKALHVDYGGSLLIILTCVLLLLPLQFGGAEFPWRSGPVISCLALSPIALGAFVAWEWKIPRFPIVPLEMLASASIPALLFGSAATGMGFYLNSYLLPQFLQILNGFTPVKAGLLFLPFILGINVMVTTAGLLTAKTGRYKALIVIGYGGWSIGQGLLSTMDRNTTVAKLVGYELISGMSAGLQFVTSLQAVQAACKVEHMAAGTSLRTAVRLIGATIGLAVAAAISSNHLRSALVPLALSDDVIDAVIRNPSAFANGGDVVVADAVIEAYRSSVQTTFRAVAGLLAASSVLVFCFVKHVPLAKKQAPAPPVEAEDEAHKLADTEAAKPSAANIEADDEDTKAP